MQVSKNYFKIFFVSALIALTLSCNLFGGLQQELSEIKSTAENISGSEEYLGTAKAFITQAQDSEAIKTAQAWATYMSEHPLVPTLEAVITEQAPGLQATLESFVTNEGPELQATAQTLLTQIPNALSSPPPDIPKFQGELENLIETKESISFITSSPLSEVTSFYKKQMPTNGWDFISKDSIESDIASVLSYGKDNRVATISISSNPKNQKTIVLIYIENK